MSNTLQVGQTYTSENGSEWECIFVRGGKAWMVGVYSGGAEGSAYAFDIDGTASWASCAGDDGYNIKWVPKRETVSIPFLPSKDNKGEWWSANSDSVTEHVGCGGYSCRVTVDIIDGTPDWTTAKVTPCD